MNWDFEDSKEAYLRGRLLGLNDLVQVLKEATAKGGSENAISKSILEHISNEVEDILAELKATVPEHQMRKIDEAEEKHDEFRREAAEQESADSKGGENPLLEVAENTAKPDAPESKKEEKKEKGDDESYLSKEQVKKADELMKKLMELAPSK